MAIAVPVNVDEILSVQFGTYQKDQAGINTIHVRVAATTGVPTTLNVADKYDDLCHAIYKDLMTIEAEYYGVRVQKVWPLPKTVAAVWAANTGPGVAGTEPMPFQISGVLSFDCTVVGQRNRGRIYIPFPDEVQHDAGANRPDAGYLMLLGSLGTILANDVTWTSGANSVTLEPVIFHRDTNNYTPVEGYTPRAKWGTVRRRGAYGQTNAYPPF